jgi:predicted dehydrogenase
MKKTLNVGVIGCGNISPIYFKNIPRFAQLQLTACADLDVSRAEARAKEFVIPKALSPDGLLADKEIDLVVNLTIPAVHAEVSLKALAAGKHVYTEKPFSANRADAAKVLAMAKEKKLFACGAPDTFLAGVFQTARKHLDGNMIGKILSGTAVMMGAGHESWHPDPVFYYKHGGGPLLDMGPYYLTALVFFLGPIKSVTARGSRGFTERTVASGPKKGEKIKVEIDTHLSGTIEFVSAALINILFSFDVKKHTLPHIELHGDKGSFSIPDPNRFHGPLNWFDPQFSDWAHLAVQHGYQVNSRGIGVAEMADAILNGRTPRASGELAYHVLDVMESIVESANTQKTLQIASTVTRPEILEKYQLPSTLELEKA